MPKSAENGQSLPLLDQKNPKFWIFPQVPLRIHARKHLGEDFSKFSAKTIVKTEVISQKFRK